MKFQRRGTVGAELPVVIEQDVAYDLRPLTADIDGPFLARNGIEQTRRALASGDLPPIDVQNMRVGAPVARPAAVVCIGQNYAAHAAETSDPPPAQPIVFFKHPNTVVGPNDGVLLPPASTALDWEVELAVVLGRQARYLADPAAALDCIAGYTISNDVSERDYQVKLSGGQWSKGKCCESFNPLGPSLVPTSDIADVQQLWIRSWVNDEPRQDSSTADMIFGVAQLIYELSQFMTLDPGDVVNTGTPQGVGLSGRFGYLAEGDRVTLAIEGLDSQHQQVVAAADVPTTAGATKIIRS